MKQSSVVVRFIPLRAVVVILVFVIGLASATPSEMAPSLLTRPLYRFSGRLLSAIIKQDDESNIILSPISIHQALSMVLLGSDRNSQTKRELINTIGYGNLSESQIEQCHRSYTSIMTDFEQITTKTKADRQRYEKEKHKSNEYSRFRNSPRTPVMDIFTMMVTKNNGQAKPEYENDIKRYFKASISSIDDQKPETKANLLKKLNDWGKGAGFDKPILSANDLDEKFEAMLIAAIQVEAFWFNDFYETNDKNIFYNFGFKDKPVNGKVIGKNELTHESRYIEFAPKEKARLKSLHKAMSKDETFNQLAGLNFHAVNLGLIDDLTITIFEPLSDGSELSTSARPNAKLNKLIEDLFSEYSSEQPKSTRLDKVLDLLDHNDNAAKPDRVRMPKFKFESDLNLKSSLQSIGIKRAFDPQLAEISNVTMNKLFIGIIKHKAVIETTKTGIKAAGVTMITMMQLSAPVTPEEPVEVQIENPFLFVLRYKTIPLFVGRLTNLPQGSAEES